MWLEHISYTYCWPISLYAKINVMFLTLWTYCFLRDIPLVFHYFYNFFVREPLDVSGPGDSQVRQGSTSNASNIQSTFFHIGSHLPSPVWFRFHVKLKDLLPDSIFTTTVSLTANIIPLSACYALQVSFFTFAKQTGLEGQRTVKAVEKDTLMAFNENTKHHVRNMSTLMVIHSHRQKTLVYMSYTTWACYTCVLHCCSAKHIFSLFFPFFSFILHQVIH